MFAAVSIVSNDMLFLVTNNSFIKYYSIKAPIPTDLPGIAAYYKQYYNTPKGANTAEKFILDYNRFMGAKI